MAVLSHAARLLGTAVPANPTGTAELAERTQQALLEACADMAAARRPFTLECFQGIERWAAALVAQHLFAPAEQALHIAYAAGSHRLAGIHQALRATEAQLLASMGRLDEAAEIAAGYALRPYLLPDRRLRPQIYRRLMAALVLAGRMAEYRGLLWRGLSDVYFDGETREWFVQQARITYRGYLRTLTTNDVGVAQRLQFALRAASDLLTRLRFVRWLRLDRALYWVNLAFGYYLAYGRAERRLIAPPSVRAPLRDRILVTRAMGGLGDLLMMTPGLRALRRTNAGRPIDLAIPRGLFRTLRRQPGCRVHRYRVARPRSRFVPSLVRPH